MLLYSVAKANTGIFIFHRSQPSLWIQPPHIASSIDLRRHWVFATTTSDTATHFFYSLSLSGSTSDLTSYTSFIIEGIIIIPFMRLKIGLLGLTLAWTFFGNYRCCRHQKEHLHNCKRLSIKKKRFMQHFTTLRPSSTIRFFFFFIQLRTSRFAMFLFPSYQR